MLASTGIRALDIFLRGGLPRGFCTLLLAPSGSGSEIFAKQFAANHGTEQGIYVSTDESSHEIQATVNAAQWDMSGVQIIDLQSDFADAMMAAQQANLERNPSRFMIDEPSKPKKRFDPRSLIEGTSSNDLLRRDVAQGRTKTPKETDTDYLGRLMNPYAKIRTPDRMVVHSVDFFLNLYPAEQVVASLTALKAANAKAGGQLLLVLAKGAHGQQIERRLELLADCLIELEMQRNGTKFDRFFMVKKVKNRTTGVGVSTYEIDEEGFSLETLERIV
ncbi:MAG: RAD55 family ATPase [Thermoplasmatota archaeon]